jgi:AraC family transcriptional regulator, positive regulator of tynA and feaB
MLTSDFAGKSELGCEAWIATMQSVVGRYRLTGMDPKAFSGRMRARNICGFSVFEHSCTAPRVVRTHQDARLDDNDCYCAIFQILGESAVDQNDQVVKLAPGDAVLLDASRPVTFVQEGRPQLLALRLPRRTLVSHLAFEPKGGLRGRSEGCAGRLLYHLLLDAAEDESSMSASAAAFMRLAVYDLVGALFVPTTSILSRTDKVFRRVCNIINDRYADPEFGPCEAAAEACISLSYLQKLFTARGLTCNRYIYSIRLDKAAHLLNRRAFLDPRRPLGEIAFGCGFTDYNHFVRKFRSRFGCTPGTYC